MIETRLIDTLAGLEAIAGAWEHLWRRAPAATPFQSPAWLIPWQRIFSPGEVRSAAAFESGQLVALAPFYLERGSLSRRLLPIGVSISDYLDILVDPSFPAAGAAALARLCETEWDEWRFEELGPHAIALSFETPAALAETWADLEPCPVVTWAGADCAAAIPARQRRKQRRAWAAAGRLGAFEIEAAPPADAFLDLMFDLHRARWESRGEAGVLADPRVQAFHRAALPGLQQAGVARTFAMTIGGRPAGAYYGFAHRSRAYAYLGGFDPTFEEASPGALTIGHAIKDAAERGATEFHFLRGREAYKYAWGATDRINRARIWSRREI